MMVSTRAINGYEGRNRGELDEFRVISIGAKHTQTRGGEAADGSAGSHGSRAGSEAHSRGTSEAEDRGHCVCVVCRCRAGEESGRKDLGKLNHSRRGDGTAAKQETREGDESCGKRSRFGGGKSYQEENGLLRVWGGPQNRVCQSSNHCPRYRELSVGRPLGAASESPVPSGADNEARGGRAALQRAL